jgi:hypothetical protein
MKTVLSASRIILALLAMPAALAMAASPDEGIPRLGLAPGEPQVRSATPALPFGVNPALSREYVLDFHGYFLLPARLGLHRRTVMLDGQSGTVLHSPPLMAQDLRDFEYTGVVPGPWLQLNFVYGNSTVSATAILAGTSASDAAGFYNPVEQFGVSDAFLTLNLTKKLGFPIQVNVGAFTGRYGAMGTYDAGRYGTPLIARTNTIGETITAGLKVGDDLLLILEQGLGGQMARPPVGLVSEGWNDFASTDVGATFVNHVHLGVAHNRFGRLGLHYLTAWTQDDLTTGNLIPDGRITVLGADVSITAGNAGHLYIGASRTWATNAKAVSGAIEILNARGGPELIEHYLGKASNGNGGLSTIGAQYDLSLARLVFGKLYTGVSPDVLVSLFGVATKVRSNASKDARLPGDAVGVGDGVLKLKGGAEVTYTFMSWAGVSERVDHVRLDNSRSAAAFTSFSSRVLFHTGWRSRDEIALQYSYFVYGSAVEVKSGYPPMLDPALNPDRHVFSLTGTFWW